MDESNYAAQRWGSCRRMWWVRGKDSAASSSAAAASQSTAVSPAAAPGTQPAGTQSGGAHAAQTTVTTTDTSGNTVTVTTTAQAPQPGGGTTVPGSNREGADRLENQLLHAGVRPVNDLAKLALWHSEPFTLLYANGQISDAFALEVHKQFLAAGPSSLTEGVREFQVHSPTTGQTYTVTCTQGPKSTECSTTTGAKVYII